MRLTSQDTQFERKLNQLLRAIRRRVRSAQKQKHCVYGEKGKTSQRRKNMSVSSSVRVVSVVSAHYIYRPVFSSHFSHTSIHYYPSKHILGGKSPELSASQGSSERPSRKVSGQSTCCSYVVRDPTKFYFPFSALPSGGLDLHLCSSENHLYRRSLHLCLVSPSA